jgi:hypothetical protein
MSGKIFFVRTAKLASTLTWKDGIPDEWERYKLPGPEPAVGGPERK